MDATSINFVIAAYTVTWVCLAAYALHAHGALRRARAEHERATRLSSGAAR